MLVFDLLKISVRVANLSFIKKIKLNLAWTDKEFPTILEIILNTSFIFAAYLFETVLKMLHILQ